MSRVHRTLCTRCPTACQSYVCICFFTRYCWILVWTKRRFVVSIHALSIFRLFAFFLFSLVLCLCKVCWYKFMEWTTETFAENPKEKLLAEFNLTMSHHSNTRAVQTFSKMHTKTDRDEKKTQMRFTWSTWGSRRLVCLCAQNHRGKSHCVAATRSKFDSIIIFEITLV